jgi:hypothetical protein
MARRDQTLGLATLCVGAGLGFAMVVERLSPFFSIWVDDCCYLSDSISSEPGFEC